MSNELQTDSIGSALAGNPPHKAEAQELADFFADFRQQFSDQTTARSREFKSFLQNFDHDYRIARKDRAASTPHFDMLRVFGLQFAELRHSDVLAWFLKPTTEHEQGSLFANALLRHFGMEPITSESYTVLRERHDRTDVTLYASGRFAVFIENKVRHWEREKQVSDMIESLVRVSIDLNIRREHRIAIFLTDKGAKPGTGPASDSAEFLLNNLKPLSRVDLFLLFRTALENQPVHSPLLMNFLDSYLNAIRHIRTQLT